MCVCMRVCVCNGPRLIISRRCDRFYLSDRPDTACLPSAGALVVYRAQHAHVFIGIFKIVREQSVAKTVEIRENTRAGDMSHRSHRFRPLAGRYPHIFPFDHIGIEM